MAQTVLSQSHSNGSDSPHSVPLKWLRLSSVSPTQMAQTVLSQSHSHGSDSPQSIPLKWLRTVEWSSESTDQPILVPEATPRKPHDFHHRLQLLLELMLSVRGRCGHACAQRAVASPVCVPLNRPCGTTTRCSLIPQRPKLVRLKVFSHGAPHGHGSSSTTMEKGEKEKGFVKEMRAVAMKLHTREQAPKEGGQQAPPKQKQWAPTLPGYLRFLVESKAVYDVLETVVQDKSHPEYAAFCNTGLERSKALEQDIAWFQNTYGLSAPPVQPDGPGATYARIIADLAKKDPQAFICHFYNFYFAHTAGGRMIGGRVATSLLDGKELNFYKWDGDMNELLDNVRRNINEMSESWNAEQKEHCLAETAASFKYSGKIMECMSE